MEFLPPQLKDKIFYEPTEHGFEKNDPPVSGMDEGKT